MALIIGGAVLGAGISTVFNYLKNRSGKEETKQSLSEKDETKDTVKSIQKEDEDEDVDDGDTDEDYDFEESRKILNVLNEDIQNIKENLVADKKKLEQLQESIRKTQSERGDKNTVASCALMQKEAEKMEAEIKKQENEIKEREDTIKQKQREIKLKMKEEKSLQEKPFRLLPGKSESLDENLKNHILQKIRKLTALPEECRFLNILLVGPTGAGKSSFVNTSATALEQKERMIHASNTRTSAAESATIRLRPERLTINGDIDLEARMFDCRGLSVTGQESIGKNEMDLIIEGHIKQYSNITDGASMTKSEDVFITNPEVKKEMHCIVYVVNASTQEEFLNDDNEKEIKGLLKKHTPTNKPQFALLTNMDKVVPRKDVKNLFRYLCVRRACNNASKITHIPPNYILPTVNYADQHLPTDDIDALCLLNLDRIVSSAHDYVIRRLDEEKEKNKT